MIVFFNLLAYLYSIFFDNEELKSVEFGDDRDVEVRVSYYAGEILEEKTVYFRIENRRPWTTHTKILMMVDLWASQTYGDLADDIIIDGKAEKCNKLRFESTPWVPESTRRFFGLNFLKRK